MDKYAYLLISVFLFFPWAVIFISRVDLRRKIIKASFLGGLAGLVAEFWYFKDYWHPPLLRGHAVVSIEDFLFGFLITGVAVAIYDAVFGVQNTRQEQSRKMFSGILFLLGLTLLLIFNNWLGFNSIFVSSIAFIVCSAIIVLIRKDLLIPAVISGILTVLVITPIYLIIFDWLFPEYWDSYYLLSNTQLGVMVLGNIPVTEIIWYFSWGCLAGVLYDFALGTKKQSTWRRVKN